MSEKRQGATRIEGIELTEALTNAIREAEENRKRHEDAPGIGGMSWREAARVSQGYRLGQPGLFDEKEE